jgi:hypothetical protein
MTNYVLDVMIEEVQFSGALRALPGPVWIVLQVDGVSRRIDCPHVNPAVTARMRFTARLVLNLPDLEGNYFKTSLCTYNDDQSRICVLANSQIKLTALPTGLPQHFTYPLLSCQDVTVDAAIVSASATISPIPREPEVKPIRSTYSAGRPPVDATYQQSGQFHSADPRATYGGQRAGSHSFVPIPPNVPVFPSQPPVPGMQTPLPAYPMLNPPGRGTAWNPGAVGQVPR